ncbi:transmembrane protein 179B [Thalassophryne amazonica]|uniref:transmembrane protein 179B n=1 Tax=Thalassophryne amazonica TaxID=390379 RepID=UPI00147125E1|nr:transmembrane protein 179B [Thalassophryne amazonica]
MELEGLFLLLELLLYTGCFICGIVTAASVTILQGNFGGRCMLYGIVNYNKTQNIIGLQSSSPTSLCSFVSAISVLVAVVCFSLFMYWLYNCFIDGQIRRARIWMTLTVGVCGVFLFFLLITGCILKIGRDSLCASIVQNVGNISRCEQAQNISWGPSLHGKQFYSSLHRAETAVWVNFFFWLIVGVLEFFQWRQSSQLKFRDSAGGLFGESAETPEESEPFFNRPRQSS